MMYFGNQEEMILTILYPFPGMTKEHAIKVWEQRKAIGMTKLSKKEWIKKYLVKK